MTGRAPAPSDNNTWHTSIDYCPRHTLSAAIATERRLNGELRRVNERLNSELREERQNYADLIDEINKEQGFD